MAADSGQSSHLSPAVVDAAAERVATVALCTAVLLPAVQLAQAAAQPSATIFNDVNRLAILAAVLAAIGAFTLRRFNVAPASTVLRLGLLLQVVVAFTLSLLETTGDGSGSRLVPGVSAVGLWIVAFSASVPNRPAWTLWTALAAATTWPLAYGVNTALGTAPASIGPFAGWLLLNYAAAGIAYVLQLAGAPEGAATGSGAEDLGGYRLVERIGEGGMGEVWKAAHKLLARAAAVKIIRPEVIQQVGRQADMAAARFRREANLIARLESPHTVYLYDFGVARDGRFYYVMELLDGISLQTLVQEFGPLPEGRAVEILTQVCQSLHEAHERSLVHRDLKPSNVMLCQVALSYDFVKVLDFGLAKSIVDVGGMNLTMVGTATGTPGYIAPENATGEGTLDRRADIYALGCVGYFLLTGRPVFDEAAPAKLALLHVRQVPERPSARAKRPIAADLEELVMECLAKVPGLRPPTMAAVGERLAKCRVEPWTSREAERWWQEHLPAGSRLRASKA
jgi:eukaryotic-like serine/threonine-protein kinase